MRDTTQMLIYQLASIMTTELSAIPCTEMSDTWDCMTVLRVIAFSRVVFVVLSMWRAVQFMRNRRVVPLYIIICTVAIQLYTVGIFFVADVSSSVTTRPIYAIMIFFVAPLLNWLRRLSWDVYCNVSTKYYICGIPLILPSLSAFVVLSSVKVDSRQLHSIGWSGRIMLMCLTLWCSLCAVRVQEVVSLISDCMESSSSYETCSTGAVNIIRSYMS